MVIEDLRVANTNLARSYKEIERANTDFVGQNAALQERIHGKLLYTFILLLARCSFGVVHFPHIGLCRA